MNMFILVRSDLDPSYRMVQGMHSVYEITRACHSHDLLPKEWDGTMVCLLVKDQKDLIKWQSKLSIKSIVSVWYEPDLDNEMTSLACFPENDKVFRNLRLA